MLSFFERNRRDLESRGIDPKRLPPGQYTTERFPVLHAGSVPVYRDLSKWTLEIYGEVERTQTLSLDEVKALPAVEITTDIHCVTKWSKFDTHWKGVPFAYIAEMVGIKDEATHLILHGEFGFTANVPLVDLLSGENIALLAYEYEGEPLEPDHGFPLRFFLPHLYFWKSAKWLRKLEFSTSDQPGFWERQGYHNYGAPFKQQRYWGN